MGGRDGKGRGGYWPFTGCFFVFVFFLGGGGGGGGRVTFKTDYFLEGLLKFSVFLWYYKNRG